MVPEHYQRPPNWVDSRVIEGQVGPSPRGTHAMWLMYLHARTVGDPSRLSPDPAISALNGKRSPCSPYNLGWWGLSPGILLI